ncbi:MAG: hypothetical protein O7G85_08630 [Planctomycetota bacterium]|nr:hypothetical protein [Planctomycetota bacterium]
MQFLIIIIVIALMALFAYFGWLAAKKRREAMALLATELGWSFSPHKDHGHDEEYAHFEIFRRGNKLVCLEIDLQAADSHPAGCVAGAAGDLHDGRRPAGTGRRAHRPEWVGSVLAHRQGYWYDGGESGA